MRVFQVFIAGFLMASTSFVSGQTTDGGMVVSGLPNNALTSSEQTDGYQLLWNGKDFTGWGASVTTQNKTPGSNWSIVTLKGWENGSQTKSLNVDSNMIEVVSSGASLFTLDTTYMDFDWKMEWQTVAGAAGNSGMLYHYQISVSTDNNLSAPEYQINNKEQGEWTSLTTTAGCNYDMLPLLTGRTNLDHSPSWVRAEGHWNQARVISFGTRTAHYGNGLRLMEYQMLSPAWNTAYNASKYKAKQGSNGTYGKLHAGSFYIQDHGEPYMKFRNIRVKKLAANENPWAPASPYLNKDSAAKGDSTLLDTLTFADNLFPKATPVVTPYSIVPKVGTKITANKDGLVILFSERGNYFISIEDVKGARFSAHRVNRSNQFFLPGRFSHSPKILTIWKDDKKIEESVIGVN